MKYILPDGIFKVIDRDTVDDEIEREQENSERVQEQIEEELGICQEIARETFVRT